VTHESQERTPWNYITSPKYANITKTPFFALQSVLFKEGHMVYVPQRMYIRQNFMRRNTVFFNNTKGLIKNLIHYGSS